MVLSFCFVTSLFATNSNEPSFAPVETNAQFGLEGKFVDNTVVLRWIPIAKLNPDGFVYYKVVRSERNASPAYPDDGYIEYSSDIGFATYTDKTPLYGKAYYRICALYDVNANGVKPRICSNVISPSRPTTETPVIVPPKEQKTTLPPQKSETTLSQGKPEMMTSTNITQVTKKRLDALLLNFKNNLEKRNLSNSEKTTIINKAIERYTTLSTSTKLPSTKKMALYMVEKLNQMLSMYAEEDT